MNKEIEMRKNFYTIIVDYIYGEKYSFHHGKSINPVILGTKFDSLGNVVSSVSSLCYQYPLFENKNKLILHAIRLALNKLCEGNNKVPYVFIIKTDKYDKFHKIFIDNQPFDINKFVDLISDDIFLDEDKSLIYSIYDIIIKKDINIVFMEYDNFSKINDSYESAMQKIKNKKNISSLDKNIVDSIFDYKIDNVNFIDYVIRVSESKLNDLYDKRDIYLSMIGDYDNFIFDKDGTQTFNYLNFDYIKNIYDENEKENNDTNGEI